MKVAVAVLILMVSLHAGEALKCKTCPALEPICELEDTQDSNCSGSCVKVDTNDHEKSLRFCIPLKSKDTCKSGTIAGEKGYYCVCNTDLCNSGPSILPPSVFVLTILLAVARGLLN